MSLSDIISHDLAEKLEGLSVDDFVNIARAGSLGLRPADLRTGIQGIAHGEDVPLPSGGGRPSPLTIQAWSFVKDHGQYHDTYGLSSARAGELTDLLRTDLDKGLAEITAVVTAALRTKGSPRPVVVNSTGMPGKPSTDHSAVKGAGAGRGALKDEIRRDGATYGLYSFEAEDTGRTGGQRYRVRLGGGLYSTHPSKVGAIDVARICRVKGRSYELIADHVAFWLDGQTPRYGDDIPGKVTFDGRLAPNATIPADPSLRAKTTVPPEGGNSRRGEQPPPGDSE